MSDIRELQQLGCPARRVVLLPKLRGTRAWSVVPHLGCESIPSVPFTSFSRSYRVAVRWIIWTL
jgi:hypothetical protein